MGQQGKQRVTLIAFAVGAMASLGSASAATAAVTPPSADPFYAPPASLASYAPGAVIRSREVTTQGFTELASTTAYQLLYRTTDATGAPIATVTTVLLPAVPAAGERKLVSYQTAEDSLTTNCAPSYTIRGGNNGGSTQWAESGTVASLLSAGWDVSVPDYEGPKSEYAVGPLEGRTTLDGIRAVEQFAPAGLKGTRTPAAMIGYSGGALPTLWANALARGYAPELNLVAAVSGGNAPNPIENLAQVNGTVFAGVIIAVSVAVDRAYPELDLQALLNAKGRQLAAQDGADASGCAGGVTNAPGGTVAEYTNYPTPQALAAVPRVQRVYARLDLIGGPVPTAPSFIYNEIHDEITIIKPVDELVASDCAGGGVIDYERNAAGEHLTGAGAYVAPALVYLENRFAGQTPINTCPPMPRPASSSSSTPPRHHHVSRRRHHKPRRRRHQHRRRHH
jgi:hypothetical protein